MTTTATAGSLPGRLEFETALESFCDEAPVDTAPVSVSIFDVDLMGRFNAEQGREEGDAALASLASGLAAALNDGEQLFRIGGDAFAILLPGVEKEQAFLRVEQLRAALAADAATPGFTVSVGVASVPDDAQKSRDLILKASEALYRAKVNGRNKVCLAREEKMVTKTSHYQQGQLLGLRRLAEREGIGEAVLLREALNDLLRKYNA